MRTVGTVGVCAGVCVQGVNVGVGAGRSRVGVNSDARVSAEGQRVGVSVLAAVIVYRADARVSVAAGGVKVPSIGAVMEGGRGGICVGACVCV